MTDDKKREILAQVGRVNSDICYGCPIIERYLELMYAQPKIVRCKDCRRYYANGGNCDQVLADWFCADGERAEENKEKDCCTYNKGRRLTDAESMGMLFDDAPDIPEGTIPEVRHKVEKFSLAECFTEKALPKNGELEKLKKWLWGDKDDEVLL